MAAVTSKLRQLVELYRQELGRYQRMLTLAEEQQRCVQGNNYQVLAEILERRDRIASEISAASVRVRAVCQQLSEELGLPEVNLTNLRSRLSEQLLDPLADVLSEITMIIEQIQVMDNESESEIRLVLDALRGQTNQGERGQAAVRAYQQTAKRNSPGSGKEK
jgi:hypothetical protein